MPDCEICGKTASGLTEITIDSAYFKVCKDCLNLGIVVQRAAAAASPKLSPKTPYVAEIGPEYILDSNYSKLIRGARVKCRMSQEDLARAMAEKESVVHRLETGKLTPGLELARKLERFLNIKLVEFET